MKMMLVWTNIDVKEADDDKIRKRALVPVNGLCKLPSDKHVTRCPRNGVDTDSETTKNVV